MQVIMEDLDFDLIVYSPYRPLTVLLKDAGLGLELCQQAWAILSDS